MDEDDDDRYIPDDYFEVPLEDLQLPPGGWDQLWANVYYLDDEDDG
jgi:hypothetical protein